MSWDFGDGNTSNELNPVHTYAVAGLYEVCLSIVNVYGCDDITCQTTEVGVDLAVNDLDNNITISPNPANEFIQVAFTTPLSGNVVIQVKILLVK